MVNPQNIFEEESQAERFKRKAGEQPMLPIGMTGLVLVCLYGAYKYKHRGSMSTSIYLMRLRVAAQGAVVGSLSLALIYQLYTQIAKKMETKKN